MSMITGKTTMASWDYGHPMPVRVHSITIVIELGIRRQLGITSTKKEKSIRLVERKGINVRLSKKGKSIRLEKRKGIQIEKVK